MKLQAGDQVAIIAPASQIRGADRGLLSGAIELLSSWGLSAKLRLSDGNHFYLAGPDLERSKYLQDALTDPEVRAVFCLRGGYGSARLLRHIDWGIQPTPKILVGYSDITSLHLAVQDRWPQIRLVHGPNVATRQLLDDGPEPEKNRESLRDLLFAKHRSLSEPVEFLRPGSAEGVLMGGCLSMVVSAIGTPYLPDLSESILFLEDTGEAPYRIDRLVTQLVNSGLLSGVKGITFGVMRGCTDPYNDLRAVLTDLLADLEVPIAFGLPSGHGQVNLSLPMGVPARLDSSSGTFSVEDIG